MPFLIIETRHRIPVCEGCAATAKAEYLSHCRVEANDQCGEPAETDGIPVVRMVRRVDPAELIRRKAEHFEVLLGLLKVHASAPDPTAPNLAFWRTRAKLAIAAAEAILAGEPDPA